MKSVMEVSFSFLSSSLSAKLVFVSNSQRYQLTMNNFNRAFANTGSCRKNALSGADFL